MNLQMKNVYFNSQYSQYSRSKRPCLLVFFMIQCSFIAAGLSAVFEVITHCYEALWSAIGGVFNPTHRKHSFSLVLLCSCALALLCWHTFLPYFSAVLI